MKNFYPVEWDMASWMISHTEDKNDCREVVENVCTKNVAMDEGCNVECKKMIDCRGTWARYHHVFAKL